MSPRPAAPLPVAREDLISARERIDARIVNTPCPRAPAFADLTDGQIHFKFESLQRTGSFKDRGSLNRLLHLSDEERRRGVVTASAGNQPH